jgi:PAS domain S-box-containing protein
LVSIPLILKEIFPFSARHWDCFFDTHMQMAAERHLEQMEGRYRGLLEAAPDAMVVVNQQGAIVLLNVQTERQFGYRRDELIGQQVKKLIPEGFAERLQADGLRSAADALGQQIGMGLELSGRRRDGSEFPIEIMLSPLESAEGILITAAIRDISVRKAAEEHLVQMESRYRGLLEAAPDAMVVVNQAGEIVLLNVQAEKQFGYRRDELVGQQVANIIPEGFAERLIADGIRSAAEALAQQIGMGIELTGRRRDGSEFPIEIMLSPLESAEGILVTAAIRDITTRRKAEAHRLHNVAELNHSNAELAEANQELDAFTYSVSHDLRAPLRHIDGFSKLLLEHESSGLSETAQDYLLDIRESTVRMGQLVDDLLALARLGRKSLGRRVTRLEPLAEEVVTELKRANADRVIEWKVGKLPAMECDPRLIRQVFVNLLSNAVKFTRPRETAVIEVGATDENGQIAIFVRDNGVGFNMKHSDRLFGVFQRLHRQEDFEGTGVGLATVQRIIRKHGGQVWAKAELGLGATFFFTLDTAAPAGLQPESYERGATQEYSNEPHVISRR